MCAVVVASALGKSKWNSVLFCEGEAVLLPLDASSANIWRKIVRVDSASSVLSLVPAIGFFWISDSLRLSCQPSS